MGGAAEDKFLRRAGQPVRRCTRYDGGQSLEMIS
jgi:hypothetical protein